MILLFEFTHLQILFHKNSRPRIRPKSECIIVRKTCHRRLFTQTNLLRVFIVHAIANLLTPSPSKAIMSPVKLSSFNDPKLKSVFKDSRVSERISQFELRATTFDEQIVKNSTKKCSSVRSLPSSACVSKRKQFARKKMDMLNDDIDNGEDDIVVTAPMPVDDELALSLCLPSARPQSARIVLTPHSYIHPAASRNFALLKRILCVPFYLPFLASVNGFGLTTLASVLFVPRFLTQILLYPVFRLVFGTLYPAYASYKAVRNKDVKDYVSIVGKRTPD